MKELTKWKLVFIFMALVVPGHYAAHAATLIWDAQAIVSPLTVERSATQAGPYSVIATLPTGSTRYILTPGAYGWYRVSNSAGPSNMVQFSLDLYTGLVTDRLTTLEANLTTLQARVSTLEAEALRIESTVPDAPYQPVTCYANVTPGFAVICTPAWTAGPVTPPAPSANLTTRVIDADHVEIVGTNCTALRTTGSGLRRIVECIR